uniref:Uncharacterized protein n=1 Tax=Anolis carolinensis TaxID=28377 RepID=A0A803SYG3_ANOCA
MLSFLLPCSRSCFNRISFFHGVGFLWALSTSNPPFSIISFLPKQAFIRVKIHGILISFNCPNFANTVPINPRLLSPSYGIWPYNFFKKLGIPGPRPLPFIGTLHKHRIGVNNFDQKSHEKYGKIWG